MTGAAERRILSGDFFCFISFLFYQKNFVMSTSTRRIKDDEVDFMPGWIERISGFSLRLFMLLSWVTQRTFCDFFGWWAFFLLMTSKQQHFSFHPIGWWAAIATRDFLPRAESLASFFFLLTLREGKRIKNVISIISLLLAFPFVSDSDGWHEIRLAGQKWMSNDFKSRR